MAFYYSTQRTYPGFRDWLLAAVGQAAGLVMLTSYPAGRPAPALLALVANAVLVASADRVYRGVARYAGKDARASIVELALYGSALAAFLYFLVVDYRVAARVAVVALCMVYAAWRAALVSFRLAHGPYLASCGFLAAVLVSLGCFQIGRAAAALRATASPELLQRSGLEVVMLALLVAHGTALVLGVLILTAHRTQVELAEARERVTELEGIIPICMYCNKVRSDEHAWDRIEDYVTQHSKASFSHGICPECLSKNYPLDPPAGGTGT